MKIDFNDPFVGLMTVLLLILAFFGYLAFFGEVEETPTKRSK